VPNNFLLILPLVAASLFVRVCFFTRYRAQSLEGYRLLLELSTFGVAFAGLSRLAVVVLRVLPCGPPLKSAWEHVSLIPYSGTAAGSIFVALLLAHVINAPIWESWKRALNRGSLRSKLKGRAKRYFAFRRSSVRRRIAENCCFWRPVFWHNAAGRTSLKKHIALNWATEKQKNELLRLLNQVARRGQMVAVTLRNRKVYIGYVLTTPSLNPSDIFVRIYPVRSGHRDKTTLCFEMTTNYVPVQSRQGELLFVVIPLGDIEVVNPFDSEVYSEHFAHAMEAQTPPWHL
jgi:hypothetical protein